MSRAFREKDASYDGVFFVGVRTTGVFCRPICRARQPNPRNVEYFHAVREAIMAGYRPCKRCHPLDTDGRAPAWVRRLSAECEARPERIRDCDLRRMGIDPARARRYFRTHYGMTFQAYDRARRLGGAMTSIRQGGDLLETAMKQGFKSDSGFREAFGRTFRTTPGRARSGECIVTTMIESPIGPLLAGATSKAVCLLEFGRDRRKKAFADLGRRFKCETVPGENEHLRQLRRELAEYFAGKRRQFTVPVVHPGTPFQMAVWKRLVKIPYGQTVSYERIARDIGKAAAQRAVGMANHRNLISIVVPCHRVVNKNGKLGGYGGGLWRKQFLLDLEQTHAD